MKLTRVDLFILYTNLVTLVATGVIIAIRGPAVLPILVATGAAMAVAGKLLKSRPSVRPPAADPGREAGG